MVNICKPIRPDSVDLRWRHAASGATMMLVVPALAMMFVSACSVGPERVDGAAVSSDTFATSDAGDGAPSLGELCVPGYGECPSGEKCQPFTQEPDQSIVTSARCVPVSGDGRHGDPCVRSRFADDCAQNFFCMGPSSGAVGSGPDFSCTAICDGRDRESCQLLGVERGVCNPPANGLLAFCDIPCNPVRPDVCLGSEGCYPFLDGFWCWETDIDSGSGLQGEPCTPDAEYSCAPGLYCNYFEPDMVVGCMTAACCTALCDLESNDEQCLPPAICRPFFSDDAVTWDPELKTTVGQCVVGEGAS